MFKNLGNYILPSVIALSALSVSVSAAFYSVTGLSKLFAGASTEVIIMAGSLEFSKLVLATLLHQYWDRLGKLLRAYLTSAVVVLIIITSMGIYGFLSAAYQETANKSTIVDTQIAFLEQKRDFYQEDVDRYDTELERISNNIATLSQAKSRDIQVRDTSSATGFRNTISTTELRLAQQRIESEEENRRLVQADRSEAADSLQKYQVAILDANIGNDIAAELGPLKYLSGLTGISMDRIINILLLIIIFVFDPLAVSMVLAANYAFDIARNEGREEKQPRKDWEKFFEAVEEGIEPNENLKAAAERYERQVDDDEDDDKLQDEITQNTIEDEWEVQEDPVEEDPEEVEEPKEVRVARVLQSTPTKRRVLFDNGKEGWVNKGDEDKIIYM
jgi:hypothetical protein